MLSKAHIFKNVLLCVAALCVITLPF